MPRQGAGMLGTLGANANCDTPVCRRHFDTGVFWLNGLFSPPSSSFSSCTTEMIELDGDEERISSQGRYAERDIVQVRPQLSECPLSRMSEGVLGLVINQGMTTAADPSLDAPTSISLIIIPLQPSSHFILIPFPLLIFPRMPLLVSFPPSYNISTFTPLF